MNSDGDHLDSPQEDTGPGAESPSLNGAPVPAADAPAPAPEAVPEDLRTPWSWGHLAIFILFAFISLFFLEACFEIFVLLKLRLGLTELQKLATTSATYVTARQALWFAALMLYLFAAARLRDGGPFWHTLGWKPLRPRSGTPRTAALLYLLGGCGMAVGVAIAARLVGTKDKLPIEALFQNRRGVLLVMTLAILGAPLVEETIFRGYIYPVVARSLGVPAGVVITGTLFGLMHAAQLWGAWGIVALLVLVGMVLTYARARTGTVLASYLLHLGYNTLLFIGTSISTRGFRQFPPGP